MLSGPTSNKSLRLLWAILSDKEFFNTTIKRNIEIVKREFPNAILPDDLSIRDVLSSKEPWMRILGGLLYGNAVLVISQLANKNMLDTKQLYFAAVYAWQQAVELVWDIKSVAIRTILGTIVEVYNSFRGNYSETTTAFVSGVIYKIFSENKLIGIRIFMLLVASLLSRGLKKIVIELIDNLENGMDHQKDREYLLLLLKIKERILLDKANFVGAKKNLKQIQEIDSSTTLIIEQAKIEYLNGNYTESLKLIDELEKKDVLNNKLKIESIKIKIGSLYKLGRYEEVINTIEKIEDFLKDEDKLQLLIDKASALIELDKYHSAITVLMQAERMLENLSDKKLKYYYQTKIYHGLGVSYASIGKANIGREYLLKAVSIITSHSTQITDDEKILIYLRLIAVSIDMGLLDDATRLLNFVDKLLLNTNSELARRYRTIADNLKRVLLLKLG